MGAVGVRLPPPPACGCRGCPSALARTPLCFNVSPTRRLPLQCLLQRRLFWRWLPRAWRLQHVPLVVPGHAEQRRRCPKGRRPKKREIFGSPETLKMRHSPFFIIISGFKNSKIAKVGRGGEGEKNGLRQLRSPSETKERCGSLYAKAMRSSVDHTALLLDLVPENICVPDWC